MKRFIKSLFIFLIILLPFSINAETTNFEDEYNATEVIRYSSGEYDLLIDDKANLLTEAEEIKLQDEMTKLLEYGNILFVSNNTEIGSTSFKAERYYTKNFGTESGTIFYIDMKERVIYIYSNGSNSKVITNMKANVITDNVYKYASDEDYYGCASKAYDQMYLVLSGGKIAEPLRYICSIIIALITSFMVCFIYACSVSAKKNVTEKELLKSTDAKIVINNFNAQITGGDRVYNPPSDFGSSGGGGGSSGGGGGGGGSGGGHRF